MRRFTFLPFVLLAGCNLDLQTDTTGELGRASFAYSGVRCEILTCSMDHSALLGSRITVIAAAERASAPARAYFANADVGRITAIHPECTPELFRCQISVDITTTGVGDGELEILDAKGGLIDKIALHVRRAASLQLVAAIDNEHVEATDGVYQIPVDTRVVLAAYVADADGKFMIHGEWNIQHEYTDETILGPDGLDILGWSDVANMIGNAPGESTVTTRVKDVAATARFRVLPRSR